MGTGIYITDLMAPGIHNSLRRKLAEARGIDLSELSNRPIEERAYLIAERYSPSREDLEKNRTPNFILATKRGILNRLPRGIPITIMGGAGIETVGELREQLDTPGSKVEYQSRLDR